MPYLSLVDLGKYSIAALGIVDERVSQRAMHEGKMLDIGPAK